MNGAAGPDPQAQRNAQANAARPVHNTAGPNAERAQRQAQAQAASTAGKPRRTMLQSLQSLWHELPGLVSDRVEILSLELQRAGTALVKIIALVAAAAILGVTAWLVLWAVIVVGLFSVGLPLWLALLLALLVNVGVAAFLLVRAKGLLGMLKLPATRRHLTVSPSYESLHPDAPQGGPPAAAPETPVGATAR